MPRPAILSRQRVTEFALEVLDAEGLAALSVERIARGLGVRAPSLYHHFADKAEILAEVAVLVLDEVRPPPFAGDWQQWMLDSARSFYRSVLRHPNAALLMVGSTPAAPAVPVYGQAAAVLAAAGVDPSVRLLLIEGIEKLTWGWTIRQAITELLEADVALGAPDEPWPELDRAVRTSPWHGEELFVTSVRVFIDGCLAATGERAFRPDDQARDRIDD